MQLKPDWTTHLHETRKREIEKVLAYFGKKKFETGLEVGSGDGYQASLLYKSFNTFTSTDFNFDRIKIKIPSITYIKADADHFSGLFKAEEFDMIFSSSVLEHLSRPVDFLKDSKVYLKKSGYAVHIVPNRFMKVAYILMFYPNLFLLILDRFLGMFSGKKVFRGGNVNSENNLNVDASSGVKQKSKFRQIFVPSVHGLYTGHIEEFRKWGHMHWERMFAAAGYDIEAEFGSGVHSGYGFGMDFVRKPLERLGLSALTVYILKKHE